MYQVICLKCKTQFVSKDEADFDGEGYCESCKLLNKEIAKRVDEQIAARRANKPKMEFVNPHAIVSGKRKGSITYFNRAGQIL